jgi:drug/metabolite transporter (DMT)-like permease
MRSVAITVVMFFICVSQFIIPLSIVHMIICSRFVFIFVIDYLINNTQLSPKQLVGMVIAIIGISLACCHELGIMWVGAWSQSQSKFHFYINDDPFIITFFSIAFVGAMALWAYAVVIGKKCRSNFF